MADGTRTSSPFANHEMPFPPQRSRLELQMHIKYNNISQTKFLLKHNATKRVQQNASQMIAD